MKKKITLLLIIVVSNSFAQTTNTDSMNMVKADEEKNEEYQKRIYKADSLFNLKEYENARNFYVNALNVSPSEIYPKERVQKIDRYTKKC